jgi:hypothetical protein
MMLQVTLKPVHRARNDLAAGGTYVRTLFVGMYAPLVWHSGMESDGEAQTCQRTARLRHLPSPVKLPPLPTFPAFRE